MYNHLLYFSYWLINSSIIFVANYMYPVEVSLSTNRFSPLEASFYAGFWMCFFVWSLWDFLIANGVKIESIVGRWILFFVINIVAVWVTSEFNRVTNFGPANVLALLTIAIFANTGQILVWKLITKSGKTN